MLELKARSQTSAAIKSLLGLAPKTARRINADGQEEDIALTHVHPGDHLLVRPGEKVPVDGCVLEGESAGDEKTRGHADRRHPEHPWQPGYGSAKGRWRHHAIADRADGGPGPALESTDAAHGRDRKS